jgi:hypothetical protein
MAMSGLLEFTVATIGRAARDLWSHDQPATVMGLTSRGIFIRAGSRVVFVSFEAYRGPLTVTLDSVSDRFSALEAGAPAYFSNSRLIFPSIEIAIVAAPQAEWPLPPAAPARPLGDQLDTLRQLASGVLARRPGDGFGALLPPLLAQPLADPPPRLETLPWSRFMALRHSLSCYDFEQTAELIQGLLGLGPGLTPSGDDSVLGLLLMLNRWHGGLDWQALNQRVIAAAYQVTTLLSANLIECAAKGEADERLLKVVDGIVTGIPSLDDCVECIMDWGRSSGIDALVGMALAVLQSTKNTTGH